MLSTAILFAEFLVTSFGVFFSEISAEKCPNPALILKKIEF